MPTGAGPRSAPESLIALLTRLAARLVNSFPSLVWKIIDTAFNPKAHLRQLGLVIAVQILSYFLRVLRERVLNRFDDASVAATSPRHTRNI